jgi:inosine/xanthosine triphosphate pyrophosphatase family protein
VRERDKEREQVVAWWTRVAGMRCHWVCVVHQVVEHHVWHVQRGEWKGQDMVVHAEMDQRGR